MKTDFHKKPCMSMFTAVIFVRAKMWKQPKCPSTDNMEYIHAMEYYFTVRRNDEMIYVRTEMHIENMLHERSQT